MQSRVVIDSYVFDATHLPGEPFVGAGHAREPLVAGMARSYKFQLILLASSCFSS